MVQISRVQCACDVVNKKESKFKFTRFVDKLKERFGSDYFSGRPLHFVAPILGIGLLSKVPRVFRFTQANLEIIAIFNLLVAAL